ncbi:unnamed protein product [Prunus armeniaca]
MCSVARARKAETDIAEAVAEEVPPEVEAVAGEGLGREVAMKERTEAMVKKRRGAAEEEVRREVGVEEEEEEVGEGEEVVVVERREVVGSMELWRVCVSSSVLGFSHKLLGLKKEEDLLQKEEKKWRIGVLNFGVGVKLDHFQLNWSNY